MDGHCVIGKKWFIAHNLDFSVVHHDEIPTGQKMDTGLEYCESFTTKKKYTTRLNELNII